MLLAVVVGPLLWVVALSTVAWVLHVSSAIELGLLIASIAAVVSTIVLALLRHARVRQEHGMRLAAEILLAFVALYPVARRRSGSPEACCSAGSTRSCADPSPDHDWPGVTILIPAYNEAAVIATCIGSVLAADYPRLEVLVLDDGSTDDTETVALAAASRRFAVQGAPRPGQSREGGAAQRRLPRGPVRARRGDGCRHARASRGAQAARCEDGAALRSSQQSRVRRT